MLVFVMFNVLIFVSSLVHVALGNQSTEINAICILRGDLNSSAIFERRV